MTPEFWSQSDVRISLEETGAKIATENIHIVDFRLTRKIFTLYLQFCSSLSIALKLILCKKWRKSLEIRRKLKWFLLQDKSHILAIRFVCTKWKSEVVFQLSES